jgi:hypothetical protein
MTVDLKIRIENGAVTVTVGGQLLQANSQAASNGQVLTTKVVGAPPQEDPIGPGGPPQEDPIGPGGADGSGVVVVVPIVITGGGGQVLKANKPANVPAPAAVA